MFVKFLNLFIFLLQKNGIRYCLWWIYAVFAPLIMAPYYNTGHELDLEGGGCGVFNAGHLPAAKKNSSWLGYMNYWKDGWIYKIFYLKICL